MIPIMSWHTWVRHVIWLVMAAQQLFDSGEATNNSTLSCKYAYPTVIPNNYWCLRYVYYPNGYCTPTVGNSYVYGNYNVQKRKENGMTTFNTGRKFLEQAYGILIRRTCLELFDDAYCRWSFPACDYTTGALKQQPICRETCELVMRMCDVELEMARKFNQQQQGSGYPFYWNIMNCSSNEFPPRNGGASPECYYKKTLNTETDKLRAEDCFYGNGLGYRGDVSVTRSGITCQVWSSQCPHRHYRTNTTHQELVNASNFCRNPGGQAPDGPWCYTSNASIRWEYCAVPKCPPPAPSQAPSSIRAFATGPTSIYIEWHPVPLPFVHGKLQGFRVFIRGVTVERDTVSNTTGPTEEHFEFTGLQPSTNYSLSVLEINENGEGPKSLEVYVKTMPENSVRVRFQLTLLDQRFSAKLKDRTSPEYKTLTKEVKQSVSLLLTKTASRLYKIYQIDIIGFTNGSLNVQFAVTAGFNQSLTDPGAVSESIVGTIIEATRSGRLGAINVSMALVRDPPPAPMSLRTTNIDTTYLTVTWSAPAYHEAYRIFNYTVQFKKAVSKISYIDAATVDASKRAVNIRDLDSATEYKIRVTSHNAYGKTTSHPMSVKTKAKPNTALIVGIVVPVLLMAIIVTALSVVLLRWWQKKKRLEEAFELERATRSALTGENDRYGSNADVFALLGIDSRKEWWEIPRDDLTIEKELGSGAFGVVKKAILKIREKQAEDVIIEDEEKNKNTEGEGEGEVVDVQECAVKMLKSNPTERELRDLCNEITIMALVGDHPNVVSLIGACTLDGPLWLVVKFAENGCFLDYIKEHRFVAEYENTKDQTPAYQNLPKKTETKYLTEREKLKFAYEIAKGMSHLEKNKCVHRDLAARNILLDKENVAMVSDFGLSRDVYESGAYDNTTGGVLPVRWMALESLEDYTYTTQSDVWSYGVLLWEMESGGLMPYAGMSGAEIVERLREGYRPERPTHCSEEMYCIMYECWNPEPKQRPMFTSLVTRLENLLLVKAGYEEIIPPKTIKTENPYDEIHLDDCVI